MDFYLKRQNILWLLFSFEGRANRTQFWMGYLFFAIIGALGLGLLLGMDYLPGNIGAVLRTDFALYFMLGLFALLLFVVILAVWIKRLHDLGAPGGVIVPIYLVPTILGALSEKMYAGTSLELPLSLASLIVSIAILWFCGFRSGEPEPNEYGTGTGPEFAISDMK
jgi:uncharacterized membrane protein YhaH (DUF805 family)